MIERRRKIIANKLGRIRDWHEMQPVIDVEPGHGPHRLAGDQSRRSDLAGLELFEGFELRHAHFFDLDSENLKQVPHRVARSATSCVDVNLLALKLCNRCDV